VESDRELMLADARSIREGLWRMAQLAQEGAESLDDHATPPSVAPAPAYHAHSLPKLVRS
jgi:hypothetical protein